MKEFTVELKDTKEHTYLEYVILASDMLIAIQDATAEAYRYIWEADIFIKYVTVADENEKYIYSVLDKTLVKYY